METAFNSFRFGPIGSVLLWLISLTAILAGFVLGARAVYRRAHGSGLFLFWGASAVAYAYGSFRVVCSRPVTCDVGTDPFSAEYLVMVAPPYAVIAALVFGAASLLVVHLSRRSPTGILDDRSASLCIGAAFGVWVVVRFLVYQLWLAAA